MADQYYIEQGYYTPDGYFVYIADAQLSAASSGTLTATVGLAASASASITATATVSCDALRLRTQSAESNITATASFNSDAVKTVDVQSSQSSNFTITASAGRILEGQGSFTGAFTPTLTVEAIKNHTAVLDANFSVVTVGVANRATSITVDTIAALDAQAAKTVDIQSTQSAATTLTSLANTTKPASATLTSTATLSVDAVNVQLAQSNLQSTSTFFTSRYAGGFRPINLTAGSPTFSSSVKKFGTNSLTAGAIGSGSTLLHERAAIPKTGSNFYIEGWYYSTSSTVSTNVFQIEHFLLVRLSGGRVRFTLEYQDPNNPGLTLNWLDYTHSSVLTTSTWHHWAVSKTGNTISYYLNGNRVSTFTDSQNPPGPWGTTDNITFITAGSGVTTVYNDEIFGSIISDLNNSATNSTITVPSSARTNDPTTTAFLYHFDGNGQDDISVQHQGQAALTSTVSLTVLAQELSSATAALTSTVSLTSIGSLLNVGVASFSAQANLTADVGLVELAEANISANATVSVTAVKITDTASTQSASASQSTDINRTRDFAVNVTGAFTPTLSIDVLRNHTAILDVVATVTALVNATVDAVSSQSTQTALSASVEAIRTYNIDANTAATQTASADRLRTTATNWLAEFQFTAQAGQEQEAQSSITAQALVSASANRTRDLASTQFAVSSLQVTEANVYRNLGDQTLSAEASVSATVTNRIGFQITATCTATISITAVKTTGIVSVQNSQFTQSTQTVKTVDPTTAFSSIATQLTGIGYNATGTVLLESTSSLSVIIGARRQYPKNVLTGVQAPARVITATVTNTFVWDTPATASVWFRRRSLTDPSGTIWSTSTITSSGGLPAQVRRLEFYANTGLRFQRVVNGSLANSYNWPNSIPNDTEWHHVLIRVRETGIYSRSFELWVDGEPKTPVAVSNWPGDFNIWRIGESYDVGIRLGYTTPGVDEPGTDILSDAEYAQLWIGNIPNNQFNPSIFWNGGAQDLGLGTAYGRLPQPWMYNAIDAPITDVLSDSTNPAILASEPLGLPDMQVRANLTVNILGVFLHEANLIAPSSVAALAFKITDNPAQLSAQSSLSAQISNQTSTGSNLSAEFTLDADVNLGPAGGAVLADHQATLVCQAGYLRDQTSTSTAAVTLSADTTVIPPLSGDAALTVFASQTTTAGYLISAQSSKSAVATMTAEGTVIDPVRASGTLQVDTALACEITRVRPGISLEMSTGTLSCDASVIPPVRATADLTVTVTMTVAVSGVYQGITLVASAGTMSVQPVYTAGANSALTVTATQQVQAFKRTGIVAQLSAQGFILTTGNIINIDPYLTLRILPELRLIKIEAETRIITVTAESRTLTIEGYSQ